MTKMRYLCWRKIEVCRSIFRKIEICRADIFNETVDNFVNNHLRVLDVARKDRWNGRLGNLGSIADSVDILFKINDFFLVCITGGCHLKISANRL